MAWQPLQGLTSWSWHHLCRSSSWSSRAMGIRSSGAGGSSTLKKLFHVGSTDYIDEDKGGSYAASVAMVLAEIEKLEKRMPSEQVLIGGFSQGAAIALHCALQHSRPLAGCVAVSGWLTASARRILSDGWKGINILPPLPWDGRRHGRLRLLRSCSPDSDQSSGIRRVQAVSRLEARVLPCTHGCRGRLHVQAARPCPQ